MSSSDKQEEEIINTLNNFIINEIKSGSDKWTIIQTLVAGGADQKIATEYVEKMHPIILKVAHEEQFTYDFLLPVLIGGCLASIVAGAIWGTIVILTGYVIGFMAVGVGFLAGYAVVMFAKGKKGIPLQTIAVSSSILGILVGKYCTFYYYLQQEVIKQYGAESASTLSMFSDKVIQVFIESFSSMLSGFDVLWFVLAIITAWRIPKGTGIKFPKI